MAKSKQNSISNKKIDQDEVAEILDDVGEDLPPLEDAPKRTPARHKYKSPKSHRKTFTRYWNDYIEDITRRENFKLGHLRQLEILCDLHEEYEKITTLVGKLGYSYKSNGRQGIQHKIRPEVQQLNRLRSDIRNYSRTLGLLLMKDKNLTTDEGDGGDEQEKWD